MLSLGVSARIPTPGCWLSTIGQLRRPTVIVAAAIVLLGIGNAAYSQTDPPAPPQITAGRLRLEVDRLMNQSTNHFIYFDTANDHSGRLFFVEQGTEDGPGIGRIVVRQPNGSMGTFLDLSSELMTVGPMGLLGLAFHPGYADPLSPGYRKLYTYHSVPVDPNETPDFTAPSTIYNHNLVTEWMVDANNPNAVDVSTRREIFREAHVDPQGIHHGGMLEFGPDGYLYGVIGSPSQSGSLMLYAQNLSIIQGKMFRIDPLDPSLTPSSTDLVSANGGYRIPADNPFVGTPGALGEVYALGQRNIHRFSFDPETEMLFAGDVGNSQREEVSVVESGANLGWPHYEGYRAGPVIAPGTLTPPHTGPIAAYTHSDGRTVVGGYLYRGVIEHLQGKYIFGEFSWGNGSYDLSSGRLLVMDPLDAEGELKDVSDIVIDEVLRGRVSCADSLHSTGGCNFDGTLYSFGIDDDGEIYVLGRRSNRTLLYKIVDAYTLAEGDYNEDGVVDAADYTVWRNSLGESVAAPGRGADGDRDGTIGMGDYLHWKAHYGEVSIGEGGAGGLSSVIPEPGTLFMAGSAVLAMAGAGRRRQRTQSHL